MKSSVRIVALATWLLWPPMGCGGGTTGSSPPDATAETGVVASDATIDLNAGEIDGQADTGQFVEAGVDTGADGTPTGGPDASAPDAADAAPACTSTSCKAPTPFCATTGECVQCVTSDNCGGRPCVNSACAACTVATQAADCTDPLKPACDPTTNQCVQCTGSGTCLPNTPYCVNHACVQCAVSGNCPVAGEVCGPNHTCSVACTPDGGQCMAPRPICDTAATPSTCVGCVSSADCAANGTKHVCDTTRNLCAQCASNADCVKSPLGSVCNPQDGICTQCLVNTDCKDTTKPVCSPLHLCVQ